MSSASYRIQAGASTVFGLSVLATIHAYMVQVFVRVVVLVVGLGMVRCGERSAWNEQSPLADPRPHRAADRLFRAALQQIHRVGGQSRATVFVHWANKNRHSDDPRNDAGAKEARDRGAKIVAAQRPKPRLTAADARLVVCIYDGASAARLRGDAPPHTNLNLRLDSARALPIKVQSRHAERLGARLVPCEKRRLSCSRILATTGFCTQSAIKLSVDSMMQAQTGGLFTEGSIRASLVRPLARSPARSFARSLARPLARSLARPLVRSLVRLRVRRRS